MPKMTTCPCLPPLRGRANSENLCTTNWHMQNVMRNSSQQRNLVSANDIQPEPSGAHTNAPGRQRLSFWRIGGWPLPRLPPFYSSHGLRRAGRPSARRSSFSFVGEFSNTRRWLRWLGLSSSVKVWAKGFRAGKYCARRTYRPALDVRKSFFTTECRVQSPLFRRRPFWG